RIRYNNAQQARTDARGATLEQSTAVDSLATLGGQLVNIIRAWAIQSEDPSIFAQAGLPAPKTPEPIAPVAPSDITFTLDPVGAIEVRWKGVKSNGTMFTVWRSITVEGAQPPALTPIATVGEKKFVDSTIPAGAKSATYIIRAVKGDQVASSGPGTVNFVYALNNGQQELSLAA